MRDETVHRRQLCSWAVPLAHGVSLELSLSPFPTRSIFGSPFGVVVVAGAQSCALHLGSACAGLQRSLMNPLFSPSFTGISFAEWECDWKVCLPWHVRRAGSALPLLLRRSEFPTCRCEHFSLRRSCQILPLCPSRTKLCFSALGRLRALGGSRCSLPQ